MSDCLVLTLQSDVKFGAGSVAISNVFLVRVFYRPGRSRFNPVEIKNIGASARLFLPQEHHPYMTEITLLV